MRRTLTVSRCAGTSPRSWRPSAQLIVPACGVMRRTCYYVLGLISQSARGRVLLDGLGWESPCNNANICVPKDPASSGLFKVLALQSTTQPSPTQPNDHCSFCADQALQVRGIAGTAARGEHPRQQPAVPGRRPPGRVSPADRRPLEPHHRRPRPSPGAQVHTITPMLAMARQSYADVRRCVPQA